MVLQLKMASSPVEAVSSRFLSCTDLDLGVCLQFQTGVRSRFVLRHGTVLSSRAVKEVSGLQSK